LLNLSGFYSAGDINLDGRPTEAHGSGTEPPLMDVFFAMACVLGLYSLHRLSFVAELSGATKRLVFWDVLLEARRSVHSLSSAAGLLRVVRLPQRLFDA